MSKRKACYISPFTFINIILSISYANYPLKGKDKEKEVENIIIVT